MKRQRELTLYEGLCEPKPTTDEMGEKVIHGSQMKLLAVVFGT